MTGSADPQRRGIDGAPCAALSPDAAGLRVGVLGAGATGRCVAATFAAAGASVRVFDPDPEALAVFDLGVALELGRVGFDPRAASRVRPVASVEAAAAGADIAFEAAPEDPGAKRAALLALSLTAPADAVIATTAGSSLPGGLVSGGPAPGDELSTGPLRAGGSAPADWLAALPGAGRIVGTLWWGTARRGGLVELTAVETTAVATSERATELLETAGRRVVSSRRGPGGAPEESGTADPRMPWTVAPAMRD